MKRPTGGATHKKNKKIGAPDKLNKQTQDKICSVLQRGGYIETAAAYAGISKQTLYDWFKRGNKQKTGKYRTFIDAVKQSLAQGEVSLVKGIYDHGGKNWQAYAWILERKFSDKYGRQKAMDEDSPMNYKEPEFLKHEDDDTDDELNNEAKKALETD